MPTQTAKVSDIIEITTKMGDKLITQFNRSNDLKVGQTALSAYKTAIAAAKAQLIYKKLTGAPTDIPFLK